MSHCVPGHDEDQVRPEAVLATEGSPHVTPGSGEDGGLAAGVPVPDTPHSKACLHVAPVRSYQLDVVGEGNWSEVPNSTRKGYVAIVIDLEYTKIVLVHTVHFIIFIGGTVEPPNNGHS